MVGAKAGKQGRSAGRDGGSTGGRQRLGLIVFGALLVVLFVVIASAQGIGNPNIPSGNVAVIEDLPGDLGDVTEAEVDQALKLQASEAGLKKTPKPGDPQYQETLEGAVTETLNNLWLYGEAEEQGISVTEKQVAAELETIKEANFPTEASYKSFLKESGLSQEEVDERVELQMLGQQLQERATVAPPSDEAIEAYYDAEKSAKFSTPETRDVRVIVNKNQDKVDAALAILEKDHSAASWKKVAPKYSSDGNTNKKGGLQEGVPNNFLEGEIQEAVFGTPTGELSEIVEFEGTYYLFEPVNITPEKVKTLAEVRTEIVSTLGEEQQQEAFAEFIGASQAKWRSRTFCADDFLVAACSNYVGSGLPESAPPACFEADPKGGRPTECPAPVQQLQPALPGTVTLLKPRGEQLAQRPFPEVAAEQGEEVPGEVPAEAPAEAPEEPPAEESAGGASEGE